jgi:hypothetical protein
LPATQNAARKARSKHCSGNAHLLVLVVGMEYLLHGSGRSGKDDGKRQRQHVTFGLDRVPLARAGLGRLATV